MAVPFILIDGYNLMHAAGMARQRYGPGDLERCRNAFLNFLTSRIGVRQRARTTVVFDAFEAPADLPRKMSRRGVEIIFPETGGDADTLIEEMIAAHSAPRQLWVVSGDRRLQDAARRRRAHFIESEQFAEELQRRGPQDEQQEQRRSHAEHPKFSGEVPLAETEEWLDVFGDIPEADDLSSDIESEQSWIRELQERIDRQEFLDEPNGDSTR